MSKINNFEEEILQIESQMAPIGSKLSNLRFERNIDFVNNIMESKPTEMEGININDQFMIQSTYLNNQ